MSSNQYLYSLIDIQEFKLTANVVSTIYDYIIQSSWNVSNIRVSNTLVIGEDGPEGYVASINGSVLIRNDCNINQNLSVMGITRINTLNVMNGANISSTLNVSNIILSNDLIIGGNITSTSDKRLKENIIPLNDCLSKITKIRGYSFTRNDLEDKNKKYLGLLAQEVEEEFPDLVTETNNTKSINYQSFVAVLLECIKELNDKLENKILI
jgi:NDP-sugar pyrophosphorylase family protein